MYKERIKKIQEELKEARLDGFIIGSADNIEYLTGAQSVSGYLLIKDTDAYFFTDPRYYERLKKEFLEIKVRLITRNWLNGHGLKRTGFESMSVTYNTYNILRERFSKIRFVPIKGLVERVRMIKEPVELRRIRTAVKIAEDVIEKIKKFIKINAGISEFALSEVIKSWIKANPHTGLSFEPITAFGKNASMPHAGLSEKRKLQAGMIVLIDLGARYNGYCSDLTRTFWTGKIRIKSRIYNHTKASIGFARFKKIYNIVLTAQQKAIEGIAPGKKCSEIDAIARNYIKKNGYGRDFMHSLGHGVGMVVHEIPNIGGESTHYLKQGMVFTVEPGIYLPNWGGVRIEDMVLVTEKGCKLLSHSPKNLEEIVI